MYWARAAGGAWVPAVLIVSFAAVECIGVATKWWLTYWSANGNPDNQFFFLGIYGALNLVSIVAIFLNLVFIMMMGLRASRKVNNELTVFY